MNQQENINAPKANATSLNCVADRPFADGVLYSNEMKMIEDLGMLYPRDTSKEKKHFAIFECPRCGNPFKVVISQVRSGHTKSCGCHRSSDLAARNLTHGMSKTKIHHAWSSMKKRCSNPKTIGYHNYGGRGITVCDEWKNDFMSFYIWSMDNGYAEGLEIDRIDVDGDYHPDNCRWVTDSVNNHNKRLRNNNTSGYRGVSVLRDRWISSINMGCKRYYLGVFRDAIDAALAYDKMAVFLYGKCAKLNFPIGNSEAA